MIGLIDKHTDCSFTSVIFIANMVITYYMYEVCPKSMRTSLTNDYDTINNPIRFK